MSFYSRSQKSNAPSQAGSAAGSRASKAGQTYAEKKAQALSAKNTAILSYDELERIKGMCSQTSETEDYNTMRKTERKDLQGLSNARVSQWPNTIQAQRQRKEEERIQKLENDEIKRREVDAEEEGYQQELRQAQLDKANKQFHDNQDMVKALHSKMLLCDVTAEQQAQRELKQRKEALHKEIDTQWEELEK